MKQPLPRIAPVAPWVGRRGTLIPRNDRSRANDVKAHDPVKINPPGKRISVHPADPEIAAKGLGVASGGMLQHALTLAARGWRVLPCEYRGKTALLPQWPERATCDPAEVRALWHRYPDANIGVATGNGSGIFVLDVDGQKGTDSLLDWASKGLQIPETLSVKTGEGFHLYF